MNNENQSHPQHAGDIEAAEQSAQQGAAQLDAARNDEPTTTRNHQAMSEEEETVNDELTRLQQALQEAEKSALRYQADLENFRRRTRREVEEQLKYATSRLLTDLLEAVDNLQRALNAAENETGSAGLVEGVRMVAGQIKEVLAEHDCKPIEAVGQRFDPNLHQAVQMLPSDEPAEQVIQELRTGFLLHDRVLRPAQVIVSTGNSES